MPRRGISLRVDDAAARVRESASPHERWALDALLTLRNAESARDDRPLEQIIDDLLRKAREWGLARGSVDEIPGVFDWTALPRRHSPVDVGPLFEACGKKTGVLRVAEMR